MGYKMRTLYAKTQNKKGLFELPGYRGNGFVLHPLRVLPGIALRGGNERAGEPMDGHADDLGRHLDVDSIILQAFFQETFPDSGPQPIHYRLSDCHFALGYRSRRHRGHEGDLVVVRMAEMELDDGAHAAPQSFERRTGLG